MKLTKNIGLILSLSLLLIVPGKEASAVVGGSAVPFMLISPDARGSGMGEVGTGIADDINAIYWNPAGLGAHTYVPEKSNADNEVPWSQIAISFSKWLPQFNSDLYYSYITAGGYVESLDGVVALNFIFMDLGEFTRTDDQGNVKGTFTSNEFTLGISYGTIIAKDLLAGFQLRYIQSNLTPTSIAFQNAGTGRSGGFDLGLLWKPSNLNIFGWDLSNAVSLGFNLQNVGPKVTYITESDPLPTNLRLGSSFVLVHDEYNDLKFALDISKLLVHRVTIVDAGGTETTVSDPLPKSLYTGWETGGVELAFGMEYLYANVMAFRAGYFTEPTSLGNRKFWNFGAGIKYDIWQLDFSYINTIEQNHPLSGTMRFSAIANWDFMSIFQ